MDKFILINTKSNQKIAQINLILVQKWLKQPKDGALQKMKIFSERILIEETPILVQNTAVEQQNT